MNIKITAQVRALEAKMKIKVLLTCETGPHAWGFASSTDPHNIGMIYMHPKEWYLSLTPGEDYLSWIADSGKLTFEGWDLRRALHLLHRSNTTMLERIKANSFYRVESFRKELLSLYDDFYAPISVMYHHLFLVKNFLNEIAFNEKQNLMDTCCAVRSALVCQWMIFQKKNAPLPLAKILNGVQVKTSLKSKIIDLVNQKQIVNEMPLSDINPEIIVFLADTISRCESQVQQLQGATHKTRDLNAVFLKWLNRNDFF